MCTVVCLMSPSFLRHISTATALDLGPAVIESLDELLTELQRLLEGKLYCMHICTHTYIYTFIHTYIHTLIQTVFRQFIQTYFALLYSCQKSDCIISRRNQVYWGADASNQRRLGELRRAHGCEDSRGELE